MKFVQYVTPCKFFGVLIPWTRCTGAVNLRQPSRLSRAASGRGLPGWRSMSQELQLRGGSRTFQHSSKAASRIKVNVSVVASATRARSSERDAASSASLTRCAQLDLKKNTSGQHLQHQQPMFCTSFPAVRTLDHQDVLCICPPLALLELPVPTVCGTRCPRREVGRAYAPRWVKRVEERGPMRKYFRATSHRAYAACHMHELTDAHVCQSGDAGTRSKQSGLRPRLLNTSVIRTRCVARAGTHVRCESRSWV